MLVKRYPEPQSGYVDRNWLLYIDVIDEKIHLKLYRVCKHNKTTCHCLTLNLDFYDITMFSYI